MKYWVGKKRPGIALLLTIGILGLISLIGISFALNMLLTRKEAANFLNSARARYIAEAGIKRAVMDIRAQAASSSYANLKTYINGYVAANGTNVPFGDGTYTLAITSEEDKVNLNTFDETDTSQINILKTFLTDQQVANIIDYRDTDSTNAVINGASGNIEGTARCKNKLFDSINEIRVATEIDQNTFINNKDKITVYKPIMRGGLLGKYYRNITGTSPNVAIDKSSFAKKVVELGAVYQTPNDQVLPGSDGDSGDAWAETHDAEFAGGGSLATPGDYGLNYFGVIWTGYLEILPAEVNTPIDFWIASDDGARFYINDGTTDQKVCDIWTDTGTSNYPWERTAHGMFTFTRPGWYRIRLEYYDQDHYNSVQLKWKDPSYGPAVVIPAERLGYDPPTEVQGGYNHSGIYTITATASAVENGQTVATRQVTAVAEVFDTWTQTTKEEFYAAWFNQQGNFTGGEVFNVNWLDSCPTDEDYWDAANSKMHWEESYTTVPDSVKLGYWDNFDEDPAFSAVMMKGYAWNRGWWGPYPTGSGTLNVSYQDFQNSGGSQGNKLYLHNNTFEAKHFELNRNYFKPNTQSAFVRSYVEETAPSTRIAWRGSGTKYTGSLPPPTAPYAGAGGKWVYFYDQNGNGFVDAGEQLFPVYDANNGNVPVYIYNPTPRYSWDLQNPPAPGSFDYWQPEAPPCGCWLFAKGSADDTSPGWVAGATVIPNGYKTLLTDGHGNVPVLSEPLPLWPFGDTSEIRLYQGAFTYTQFNYLPNKVISMIGWDNGVNTAQYAAWINGGLGNNLATWAAGYPSNPIFKFVANNQYLGADWATFDRGQHIIGPADWPYAGAVTAMDTYWDDMRCMAANGYIVSTPFYAGPSPIRWGTISWAGQAPGNTAIAVYDRTATAYSNIPATDTGWAAAAGSGAAIGGTSAWLQYKAVLSTTAIDRTNYQTSSRTPVLQDITVTYFSDVRIKYWRQGS